VGAVPVWVDSTVRDEGLQSTLETGARDVKLYPPPFPFYPQCKLSSSPPPVLFDELVNCTPCGI
jgi:hypothetical protein